MKLLIGGKSRNIYMRKDGSAYYKSGGQQVDITHMFKKNGGGLKKQYISGVEGNLAKVEKNKRSNKCAKQILGGAISDIKFDPIKIESEKIMDNSYQDTTAPEQLKNICCLALYGLGAAMAGQLNQDQDKDKIKVTVGKDLETFVRYLQKSVPDGTAKTKFQEILSKGTLVEKLAEFKTNIGADPCKPAIKELGFENVTDATDFSTDDKCVTVTRAYILNKILQCFLGDPDNFIAHSDAQNNDPATLLLSGKNNIINPSTGVLNTEGGGNVITQDDLKKICTNILAISILSGPSAEIPATNLYKVLFLEEQIGAPAVAVAPGLPG